MEDKDRQPHSRVGEGGSLIFSSWVVLRSDLDMS
jgi:hypothetical protein